MKDELTLEKMAIHTRLQAVEIELQQVCKEINIDRGDIKELLKKHETAIYGSNCTPGLKIQVDRIEGFIGHIKGLWSAIGTIGVATGGVIIKMFIK